MLAAWALPHLAGAQQGATLRCEVRYMSTTVPIEVRPTAEPYTVAPHDIGGRFRFKAAVVGDERHVAYVALYTYDMSVPNAPVLVHEAVHHAPFDTHRPLPGLTGWNHVYSARLGREMVYGCGWHAGLDGRHNARGTVTMHLSMMARRALIRLLLPAAMLASVMAPLEATAGTAAAPAQQGAPQDGPTVSIAFMGDVMLAEGPGRLIKQGRDPFAPFAHILAQADVRVANLECVVATTGEPDDKPYTFRAHPRVLRLLKQHVDAVSLANNHSGDFGRGAFAEMLGRLQQARLPYFGGGADLARAHAPLIIERKGLRIALLGYDEFFPRHFEAGHDHPGVAWSEDEQVAADIRQARQVHHADLVIPFMHWGEEHRPTANDRQRRLARTMIEAGADAVVGTHPHVVQDVEYHRGKPIVYSLGNFIFDGFDDEDNNTGWVLWMEVARSGVIRIERHVARIDRDGTPHPVGNRTIPLPAPLQEAGGRN